MIEHKLIDCRKTTNISTLIDMAIKLAQHWNKTSEIPLVISAVNTQYFQPIITRELIEILSTNEIKRYLSHKHTNTRINFCVARVILRAFASHTLDIKANEIQVFMKKNGKPYIIGNKIRFNVTHSGTVTMIAFDKSREIGIDVEEIKFFSEWQSLAMDLFGYTDVMDITSLSRDLRIYGFYRKWTQYESMGKAVGCGLSILKDHNSKSTSLEKIKRRNNIIGCSIESINGYTGYCSIVDRKNEQH